MRGARMVVVCFVFALAGCDAESMAPGVCGRSGDSCASGSLCCAGFSCSAGVCTGASGSDASGSDGGLCAPSGASCSGGAACCAGLVCIAGRVCGPGSSGDGGAMSDAGPLPDGSVGSDAGSSTPDGGAISLDSGGVCAGDREACDVTPCCSGFECRATDSGLQCRRTK